jgi:type IX secretion system PorP/SprF family membrane protein
MKLVSIYLLIITGLIIHKEVMAQSDISMATHWYNRANYNPSSISKPNYAYLFSNYRQQWIGVKGAPQVFNIQASEYLHKLHSAFGLSMVSDKIGVSSVCNPMASYAYRISKASSWALSMGLSAGLFLRTIDGTLYESETEQDPSVTYEKQSSVKPDFNAGIELQTNYFIIGFSSTHLSSISKPSDTYLNTNHRYGYLIYKNSKPFAFNYNLGFLAVNRNNLTVLEGNVSLRFKKTSGMVNGPREIFDVGLTYRTSQQLALLLGINILPNARLGYVFEQSFRTGYYLNSTHEIALEWRIPSKAASGKTVCEPNEFWTH